MDIFYFQKNAVIERISVDDKLKIFVETNNEKHYAIIFSNYREIYIRNNISAESWESEIGEIELFREAKFEKSQVYAHLVISNHWDDELIFSAYVGNYVIKET
ncbi:MAG: hypothetical protein J6B75_07080 [Ruminococcus sp.]|nr:hypothetical protein [Ruminococcus sp.]